MAVQWYYRGSKPEGRGQGWSRNRGMRHGWSNPVCHFGTKRAESAKSGLIWAPSQRVGSKTPPACYRPQTSPAPRGIAPSGAAYYPEPMTTISLKLPEHLLRRLEKESRARGTTKSSVVRECLEQQLPDRAPPEDLPELPPGESFYDKALPILKKAWARNRKLPRDLATNPKYMKGFGE